MEIEKWIKDKSYLSDDHGVDFSIDVEDLRELLKTHVLVPKEPTEAMLDCIRDGLDGLDVYEDGSSECAYKAMLKAAQENS